MTTTIMTATYNFFGLALFQVLEHEGLDRYIDPHFLQQEIAEATGARKEELDQAARELLVRSSGSSPSNGNGSSRPPYYEHLGGYSMQEMKDYNQYSRQDDLLKPKRGYSQDYSDEGDDMVYVTTL